jgi:hypothetical protein
MPFDEFVYVYAMFCITYVRDDFQVSYVDKRNAGSKESFEFTV